MEGAVADSITNGIDLLIVGVFIVGFVAVLGLSINASEVITNQNDLAAELAEYREYNQFDGTIVYPQDVVSAIYRYRGDPYITVSSSKGNYTWSVKSKPCEWNTAKITELIDQEKMYDATVIRGVAGDIVGYEFKAR